MITLPFCKCTFMHRNCPTMVGGGGGRGEGGGAGGGAGRGGGGGEGGQD